MFSRSTALIALSQTLVIVLGFIAVGVVLKFSGYPENARWVRWNPVAVFLRHYGLILLLVPMAWTYFAARSLRHDSYAVSYQTMMFIGITFAALVMFSFIYAAVCPFTMPIPFFWN